MNYNIKGTGLSITPEIRSYVEKRLATLDKFLEDVSSTRADIELEFLQGEAKMYRAEIMLREPGFDIRKSDCRGHGLHEAFDLSAGELFQELTRTKKKKRQLWRRSAVKVKEFLRGWRKDV
jgi:ribosomal subunit interface protein